MLKSFQSNISNAITKKKLAKVVYQLCFYGIHYESIGKRTDLLFLSPVQSRQAAWPWHIQA